MPSAKLFNAKWLFVLRVFPHCKFYSVVAIVRYQYVSGCGRRLRLRHSDRAESLCCRSEKSEIPPRAAHSQHSVAVVIVTVIVMMVVMVIAVVVPAVAVPVVVVIPVVVVLQSPAIAIPVPHKILSTFMARADPARAGIGRPRPIALVPLVVLSVGIPIALNPHKVRSGACWNHGQHSRGRRSSDVDSNRNLSARRRRSGQQQCACQQARRE
jgi:hypothetical protein